ncbi:MAG: RNA polymerase sigma-70 factor [Candidatus Pedobacter colombiensis]|uniref:RNA polymerase sigma-70 factor n=1 Tax=Candidatus Pedobacter colombiensis TaxID=3121371 RepID=A0AAJ5WC44_9SPHI|nr:RNA polymerase sigma-70 factor [Pedobacter sp.]WEK21560.1 MAG: RNA polymerase sigma-70 factor [Pedobacter sp.]
MEDQYVLEAIRKQDKKVFELFYKKYYKQLFALAYRYVGQMEVAEEIVHDLFVTVWNKADQLNIQQSVKSYLFKAIVNSSLNYIKKEKMQTEKRLAYLAVQDNEVSLDEENKDTDEKLLKSLEEALELLPAKCKQVMYLSRFGKLKQQEIANQMEISLKTVKNHLTYGFQKLREHLANQQELIILLLLLLKITFF